MSNLYNLDVAADYVKQIVDSVRCVICDEIDGARSRYTCGHTACSNCVATAQSCLLCLTPPQHDEIFVDVPLTRRAKHAAELLSAFQSTFNFDVSRCKRISEQLKIEKELFPQCIQAPVTYYNRNRSSKSIKTIDNHCILPGEIIEAPKMDRSRNFVQDWLEKNEDNLSKYQHRSPLSDLKVNSPRLNRTSIKKRADIILEKVRVGENKLRHTKSKKGSFKTALTDTKSQSRLDKYLITTEKGNSTSTRRNAKEVKNEFEDHEKSICHKKSDNDESGIVMDDDPIVIEDSQSQVNVNKDVQAWLAVLKACENEGDSSQESVTALNKYPAIVKTVGLNDSKRLNDTDRTKKTISVKVPFYKKSSLVPPFTNESNKNNPIQSKIRDVSITVESHALVTTIQVSQWNKPMLTHKISKSVQTDADIGFINNYNEKHISTVMTEKAGPMYIQSRYDLNLVDVFKSQEVSTGPPAIKINDQEIDAHAREENNCVIIESGSESEQEHSCLVVVTADVHPVSKSDHMQRGILSEMDAAPSNLRRPQKRGYSTGSSNSSDKENRDPNARKKPGNDKKRKKRKH